MDAVCPGVPTLWLGGRFPPDAMPGVSGSERSYVPRPTGRRQPIRKIESGPTFRPLETRSARQSTVGPWLMNCHPATGGRRIFPRCHRFQACLIRHDTKRGIRHILTAVFILDFRYPALRRLRCPSARLRFGVRRFIQSPRLSYIAHVGSFRLVSLAFVIDHRCRRS